ncbi:hypothetical protein S83_051143, partial [Arachis hypogaea]
ILNALLCDITFDEFYYLLMDNIVSSSQELQVFDELFLKARKFDIEKTKYSDLIWSEPGIKGTFDVYGNSPSVKTFGESGLPPVGTHVFYFPQGHSEQVAASLKKDADPETDEVYAQMTLQHVLSVNELELPFLALLLVILFPYEVIGFRDAKEGAIISLLIAVYLAYQYFSTTSLQKLLDQGSI